MENNQVDENEKVTDKNTEVSEDTSLKDSDNIASDTPFLGKEVQENSTDEKIVDSFAMPKEDNFVQPAIAQEPNFNPADNTSTGIENNPALQNKTKEAYSLDDKKIKKIVVDDIDETNEKLDKLEQETSINQEKKYVTNNHVYTVIKQISDLDTVQFYQVKREDNETFLLKLFKTKQDIKTRTAYLYALEKVPSDVNLVHIYDTGTEGEYPFDIIDNHEGQSLSNTKLSTDEIKIVLASISKALNFVHKSGYAHLNINLENVFYDKEKKTAYLGDFVTKNHSNGLPVNKKLGYYAPELYQNITSISADYYALGVVLAGAVQ